jgi:hypothetical protein
MKNRRHHNNKGRRQIQNGNTVWKIVKVARDLRIPYKKNEVQNRHESLGLESKRYLGLDTNGVGIFAPVVDD